MIKKLTLLRVVIFLCIGVLSQQAVALQNDASKDPTVILMQTGTVTTCDAFFYDSGGPTGNYSASENHFLVLIPETPGTRIKITFLEFETENNYDKLFVYNGESPTDPLLATLTGSTVPTEPFYGDNQNGALSFKFTSDASLNKAGWKATVKCYTPVPNNMVAISLNTTNYATVNLPKTIPFAFFNQGSQAVTGSQYSVQLQDAANNVLATANGIDLIPGEHASIDLIWTPTTTGTTDIKGVILFAEDQIPEDNSTPYTTFTVHPTGTYVTQIGSGATVSNVRIPFDFYYKNSYAQTIYTAEQLGVDNGVINSITYKYNFPVSNPGTKGIKVWIGETTLTNLNGGFINPNELTLVYDGDADFHSGINEVTINLQTPYVYSGTNLVIYTYRNLDTQCYTSSDLFYVTSTEENRSRRRQSDSQINPLAPSGGFSTIYIPDISIVFYITELGTISGNVTCEGAPAAGVTVKVIDGTREATTDAAGHYTLPYLIPGTHSVEFTKFGFTDILVENIQVVGNETTTVNTTISPIQQYMVSGTVTASDTGLPLEGAIVNFYGYADYTDTTDAAGHYSMSEVWGGGKEYEVVVDYEGYQQYTGTVTVNNQHVTDHNIIVNEIAYPVGKVTAIVQGANVKVNWKSPSGTIDNSQWISWCGAPDPENAVGAVTNPITCAHRFSAAQLEDLDVIGMSITKVRFFPKATGTYKVLVWLGGSATDPGTLTHEQVASNVEFSQWNEVELTTPVVVPEGQELWYGVHIIPVEHYPGGVDEGPAIAGFGDWIKIANGAWETLTSHGLSYNWALGAYVDDGKGLVTNLSKLRAEYEMNAPKVNLRNGSNLLSELRFTSTKESGNVTTVENSENIASRAFVNYTLYRLVKDQPQTEWTQLVAETNDTTYTDTDWGTLPAGLYQYAVVANYTNNVTSQPRLSNTLAKDMETEFTVNVTTNSGDPATGAEIILTNQDGNEDHVYEAIADETGATFPAVWKGVYDITVTKFGFEPFAADSVVINTDATYPVELIEIIQAPVCLIITQDGNDEILTWNNPCGTTIILQTTDVWGNSSGYQMLLDADAEEYGQTIPTTGALWQNCSAPTNLYDVFEYTIPENADPVCTTQNMVCNREEYYVIAPGTYDYCIVNPTPNDKLWIASGENGRKDNYRFDGSKTYRFFIEYNSDTGNDQTTIIITDDKTGKIVDIVRPGGTVDEYSRIGEVTSNQVSVVSTLEIGDYYNGTPNQTRAFSGYTIYLDGEEKASGIMNSTYTFINVPIGEHTAGVKAVYTSGSSEIVELDFIHHPPMFNVRFIVNRVSNGVPIIHANVVISNESVNESALTNTSGVAKFELPGGNYDWIVTKEGFETQEDNVTVTDHTDIYVNMYSIGDDAKVQGIMLYPNPATNTLTITRENSSNAMVEIYSNNGKIVNSFEMNEAVKEISVSELSSGVYFIRIIENETTIVQRFIKQ